MLKGYKLGIIAVFFFLPLTVRAAFLDISPSSGSYKTGANFTVGVYVGTSESINAISGRVYFPTDKLETVSVSKSGSIFSLWVQEPIISSGIVSFEGIILNPGYTGTSGKLVNITFKVKAAGDAKLGFSSASVLANDGKGTNVLTNIGSASYSLGDTTPSSPDTTTPTVITGTPGAPQLSSSTHPDQNKWYANNTPVFSWPLPSGVTAVRTAAGIIPKANPTVVYSPPVASRNLDSLNDGVWYFHTQFRNATGWGEITHFRFQIDTQKPTLFNITEVARSDQTLSKIKFSFDAQDETSGISYYEIKIDNNEAFNWEDDGSHQFETAALFPGKHSIFVKAFDQAGNWLANTAEFNIEPLKAPAVTDYKKSLSSGDVLTVKGVTYGSIKVVALVQKDKEEIKTYTVDSDQEGNFSFILPDKVQNGIYSLWFYALDNRDSRSLPSEKNIIEVKPTQLESAGFWLSDVLSIIVPLIALIILLILVILRGWHKINMLKKKLRKEVFEAEKMTHKAFADLRAQVSEQVKILQRASVRRKLTREESKILKELGEHIDTDEQSVIKEIEDIEDQVK